MKSLVLAILLLPILGSPARSQEPVLAPASPAGAPLPPPSLKNLTWGPLTDSELRLDFGGSRATSGTWVRWKVSGDGFLPRRARIVLPGAARVPGGAMTRIRTIIGTLKSTWIHRTQVRGDDVIAEVEVPPRVRFEVLWVPLAAYDDWNRAYQLREDPEDPHPLGSRRPLILIHGLMFSHPHVPLARALRATFLHNFRKNPGARALRRRFKLYHYEYPTLHGAMAAARKLVAAVRELYPAGEIPPDHAVIVAHSLGGLVARQAMNLEGFGDKVQRLFTLATPHHGTLIASLANGSWNMREKIPEFDYGILRNFTGMLLPDCHALWDLWWDDHDGRLGKPGYTHFQIPLNTWLKDLNARDAYLAKLTVYMGDCPSMRWPLYNLPLDYIRWAQGIFGEPFRNSDPLVPHESGIFAGAPVTRRVVRKVTHVDWVFLPRVLDPVIQEIADLPALDPED